MAALYQVSYGPFSAQKANSRDLRGAAQAPSFASARWQKGTVDTLEARSSSGSLISPRKKTVGKRGPWTFGTRMRGGERG